MLEVITGCMYSGKSVELIRRLRRCQIAGQNLIAFKSGLDDRYSTHLATHPIDGAPSTLKAETVGCTDDFMEKSGLGWHDRSLADHDPRWSGPARYVRYEMLPMVRDGLRCRTEDGRSHFERIPARMPDVVGFDEVQFMDGRIVPVFEGLANQGVRVIVAGLDLDSNGKPFGPMAELLARADKVTKLTAVCVASHPERVVCGKAATRSYRLPEADTGQQVQVGSAGVYEAHCRACWARSQS
jgi:thymidine kinase